MDNQVAKLFVFLGIVGLVSPRVAFCAMALIIMFNYGFK